MGEPLSPNGFLSLLGGMSTEPVWIPVLSGSMSPTLIPGDLVLIVPGNWKKCAVGDIIVFREAHSLTSHRLIGKIRFPGKAFFFQQADGMNHGGFIPVESVIGTCATMRRHNTETTLLDRKINKALANRSRMRMILFLVRSIKKWMVSKAPTSPSR